MQEHDFLRKCAGALLGVAVTAAAAVFISWWLAALPADVAAPPPKPARPAAAAPVAAPAPPARASAAAALPPPARPGVELPAAAADAEALAKKAFRLEMENARLRHRLDDLLNWLLDNVRGTFPLPEEQMANLRVAPVDTNLQVSADLAQILDAHLPRQPVPDFVIRQR